ncbi:hypothetical protein CDL15_Pgr023858 [Punica granatum]|uniref:Extensin-like n=1 Tax=Punica granatum TaxID=22663 RepID=A0A218XZZ2_PUNGR|nr:hypothetical protein CDL15_Pgr023858 [Punica granatum]
MAGENPLTLPEDVISLNVAHVSSPPTPVAMPPAVQASPDERIAALEGTVNLMAANMAELISLLRNPNRASSSFAPAHGPTVNLEAAETPDAFLPPPFTPAATFDQGMYVPQLAPIPVPAPVYTAPPPIITSAFAPAHTAESVPYCQHPILAHRLPTRGFPTEARDTIHHPAIRDK